MQNEIKFSAQCRIWTGLDMDLIRFNRQDSVTYRDALSGGISVIGSSGSGKSSSVCALLVSNALRHGCSVVVSTIKPQDPEYWAGVARSVGCPNIRVFRPGVDRFNPILYEQQSSSNPAMLAEDLTQQVLLPLRHQRVTGGGSDPFWISASEQHTRRAMSLYLIAGVPTSYRLINDTMLTLPRSREDVTSPDWQRRCPIFPCLIEAQRNAESPAERIEIERSADFLLSTVPSTPDNTLGSMIATLTGPLDPFVGGLIGETLNAETHTWTPDEVIDRPGLFMVDTPIQSWGQTGATLQRIVFTAIQRAITRRAAGSMPRPVMLMMDEAQEFLDPDSDPAFMRTARDRLAFVVLATQCVDNIRMACSSARDPNAAAKAILALPSVQFFCQTADPETRRHASEVFGRTRQARVSMSTTDPQRASGGDPKSPGREPSRTRGANVSFDYMDDVAGIQLATLKRGGPTNGWKVEALVAGPNPPWKSSGRPSLLVSLPQYRSG